MKDASEALAKPGATFADTYRLPLLQWKAEIRIYGCTQWCNNVALWRSKTGSLQFHEWNLLRRGTSTKLQLVEKGHRDTCEPPWGIPMLLLLWWAFFNVSSPGKKRILVWMNKTCVGTIIIMPRLLIKEFSVRQEIIAEVRKIQWMPQQPRVSPTTPWVVFLSSHSRHLMSSWPKV